MKQTRPSRPRKPMYPSSNSPHPGFGPRSISTTMPPLNQNQFRQNFYGTNNQMGYYPSPGRPRAPFSASPGIHRHMNPRVGSPFGGQMNNGGNVRSNTPRNNSHSNGPNNLISANLSATSSSNQPMVVNPGGRILERQLIHPAHNRIIYNANKQNYQNIYSKNPPQTNPNLTKASGPYYGGHTKFSGIPPKLPSQPNKPLNANMRYGEKIWNKIKAEKPKLKTWEISKEVNLLWRELPQSEKQPYIDEAEAEKVEYNIQMSTFHKSVDYQNYQNYLNATKNQIDLDSVTDGRFKGKDLDELYAIEPARDLTKIQQEISKSKSSEDALSGLEGIDDELDLREIAAKRFKLNHENMLEIFDSRFVGVGWGAKLKASYANVFYEHDRANVTTENFYTGSGCLCNIPTVGQLKRLEKKTKMLEELVLGEQEDLERIVKSNENREKEYSLRSKRLDKIWEDICNESPEETFKKRKALEEIKKQNQLLAKQEFEMKKLQEKEERKSEEKFKPDLTTIENKSDPTTKIMSEGPEEKKEEGPSETDGDEVVDCS